MTAATPFAVLGRRRLVIPRRQEDASSMLRSVEVCHEGRWLPATLLATRLDDDGWHGLVGFTHPSTREGFYRWVPESMLRDAADELPPPPTFAGRTPDF